MSSFKILNDISKRESTWKNVGILMVIGSFIVSISCMYLNYVTVKESKERIYVWVNDFQLAAVRSGDIRESIEVTSRGHIKRFHELLFILEPDTEDIKENIEEKALFMIDDSGSRFYNYMEEKGYYKNIVAGSYSTDIKVDSISVDFRKYPFSWTFYGKQKIIKKKTITYRNLITKGKIREAAKVTDNNPLKFMLENFEVVDNMDIETINKKDERSRYGKF